MEKMAAVFPTWKKTGLHRPQGRAKTVTCWWLGFRIHRLKIMPMFSLHYVCLVCKAKVDVGDRFALTCFLGYATLSDKNNC